MKPYLGGSPKSKTENHSMITDNSQSKDNINNSISKLIQKYTKGKLITDEDEDDSFNSKQHDLKFNKNNALRFSKYSFRKEMVNQSWKVPIISYFEPEAHKEKNKGIDFAKMKQRNQMDMLSSSNVGNPSICYYSPKYDYIMKSAPGALKFNTKEQPKNTDKNYLIKKMWRSYDVSSDYKLVKLEKNSQNVYGLDKY